MDIAKFNADWLKAWSDKDTERLIREFYSPTVVYRDPRVPGGVTGSDNLRAYLNDFYDTTPPTRYDADGLWNVEGGYVARWICTIELPDGTRRYRRGLDLVLLEDGKITLEEVYVHNLASRPS